MLQKHTDLMHLAGVQGTPTFILLKDGKPTLGTPDDVVAQFGPKEPPVAQATPAPAAPAAPAAATN